MHVAVCQVLFTPITTQSRPKCDTEYKGDMQILFKSVLAQTM